jgi:hypothetical protein
MKALNPTMQITSSAPVMACAATDGDVLDLGSLAG